MDHLEGTPSLIGKCAKVNSSQLYLTEYAVVWWFSVRTDNAEVASLNSACRS